MATAASSLLCDPCTGSGDEQEPVAFCLECRELYCNICLKCHKNMKLTKSHLYGYLSGDVSGNLCPCDLCKANNKVVTSLCIECRELYCTACTIRHRKLKTSKQHVIVNIASEKLDPNVTYSGAQVPLNKNRQQNQHNGTYTDKEKTGSCLPDDNKSTHVSKPFHSDNTATPSDVKSTSLSSAFHRRFSVSTSSDTMSPYITRMISMPDGRICVVDNANEKIKLYTQDYLLCDEFCLPFCRAVTCVDADTVAVTARSDITRYSVKGNKIKQTGGLLHIDGVIYDIAYKSGEFIIRYQKDNTDYTCCGSKLVVKQDRNLTDNNFLYYDASSNCVLLGNFFERTITCYTLNGDVKWRTTLGGRPTGMVVVKGVVLVADYVNLTICQVTMEGHLLSSPLLPKDRGSTRLFAITYQHQQHRLLIAKFQNDNVNVFQLSH